MKMSKSKIRLTMWVKEDEAVNVDRTAIALFLQKLGGGNQFPLSDFDHWYPKKWKGPAFICPDKHQMPQEKIRYTLQYKWGKTYCPGCSRWVDHSLLTWDEEVRQRTMGYAERPKSAEDFIDPEQIDSSTEERDNNSK